MKSFQKIKQWRCSKFLALSSKKSFRCATTANGANFSQSAVVRRSCQTFDRLPERRVKSLLGVLTPDNRSETLHLQAYVPETAGRIMTTEFVTLTEDMTQEEALAKVTEEATRKENIYILFIIDEKLKLTGFITLHRLLMMAPTAVINEHMSRQPISVKTSEDQEKVAQKVKSWIFWL